MKSWINDEILSDREKAWFFYSNRPQHLKIFPLIIFEIIHCSIINDTRWQSIPCDLSGNVGRGGLILLFSEFIMMMAKMHLLFQRKHVCQVTAEHIVEGTECHDVNIITSKRSLYNVRTRSYGDRVIRLWTISSWFLFCWRIGHHTGPANSMIDPT